jgi:hypothetical protein
MKFSSRGNFWTICRILIITTTAFGIALNPRNRSNEDWRVGVILGVISFITMSAWVFMIRSSTNIDWSEPYSWRRPFYPMKLYPLRFLFLASLSIMAGGVAATARDVVLETGHEGYGATFILWGAGVLATLKVFDRIVP